MKRLCALLVLLLVGYALPAQALTELGASADDAEVEVGCLYPLSGINQLYGRDSLVAIELALEDIARTMPEPPRIRILVEDTKLKASRTIRLVRNFAQKHQMRFICGIVSSGIALEVTKIIDDLGVIFVGTDHASSRLTNEALSTNYFRLSNNTRQSMVAGATYVKQRFEGILSTRPLEIAYIGPDYDYGYRSWRDFRAAMDGLDLPYRPVAAYWPKPFETDYSLYIRSLRSVRPDVVINTLWGNDLVAFVRQAQQTPLFDEMKFANFDTGGNFEVLAALGDDLPLGLILGARHHVNWPQTQQNRTFVRRFFDRAGRYPSYAAQGAYSGILAIAHALAKTDPKASTDQLREALLNLRLKLPEDPDGFTSFMNPKDHQIQQVIAIGETIPNRDFPPATRLLGNWQVFYPDAEGPVRAPEN
ncbi:MAG: ABC transporter substrate-binding protein [Magnetovibrionaceae bacterium]